MNQRTIVGAPPPLEAVPVADAHEPLPTATPVLDRRPALAGFLTLGIALVAAFAMYAVPVLRHFSTTAVGDGGADNRLNIWMLAWWPFAIAHHLNPLHSGYVWAPQGVNMAWVTGLPGPSLVMWPVTSLFGSIVSSNVLAVLGPVLNTWAAYLLCRRVSRGRYWPALVGGCVFGFSTYVTSALNAHINLYLVFPVPIAVYLVVRAMEGSLKPARFVALLTLVLVAEFSISTEVFLSMTLFGLMAMIGTFALAKDALRSRLPVTGLRIGAAYLSTAVVVSPYLIAAFSNPPSGPLRVIAGGGFSSDLLSFFLPGLGTAIGGHAAHHVVSEFHLNPVEDGSYLGLFAVLLVIAVVQLRRDRVVAGAALFAGVSALCSLGTDLHIAGHSVLALPWSLMGKLPIVQDALPFRFPMFMWIGMAVIMTRWLTITRPEGRPHAWSVAFRYAAVGLAMISVFPNLWAITLHRTYAAPAFFTSPADLRATVPQGGNVLIIHADPPNGADAMLWQTQANHWFTMAQGYTGIPPGSFATDPVWRAINRNDPWVVHPASLLRYLREREIGDVIVTDAAVGGWGRIITEALGGAQPSVIGGVAIWRTGFGKSSAAPAVTRATPAPMG